MSAEKTEAQRLADEIEGDYDPDWLYEIGADEIAAELRLRRLAAENDALGLHLSERMKDLARIEAQRDALLEALKYHQEQTRPIQRTLDVIKAVEGEKK
jgi:hypothetical protein